MPQPAVSRYPRPTPALHSHPQGPVGPPRVCARTLGCEEVRGYFSGSVPPAGAVGFLPSLFPRAVRMASQAAPELLIVPVGHPAPGGWGGVRRFRGPRRSLGARGLTRTQAGVCQRGKSSSPPAFLGPHSHPPLPPLPAHGHGQEEAARLQRLGFPASGRLCCRKFAIDLKTTPVLTQPHAL